MEAASVAEREQPQLHNEAFQNIAKPEAAMEKAPPQNEAREEAGDAAIRRMASEEESEGGFPEAGEKVGDKGKLTRDVWVQVDGRTQRVAAGTEVTVKQVLGNRLVVALPSGGEARIKANRFQKEEAKPPDGGGGDTTQAPAKPANPLQDPAKNPDPTNEYAPNATYGEQKGVVSVKGDGDAHEIAPDDVEQGALGDCYFVAQLAAQAKTNPDRIKNLIKDNGDGTYTVTLHLKDKTSPGKRVATQIVVDSQFPMKDGGVAYAKPGDSGAQGPELWVMLIEKAFAKYSGSYEQIRGSKTKDGDVFAMMSGEASSSFSPASAGGDALLDRVSRALASGRAVSLGAKSKNTADEKVQQEAKEAGVVLNHAYAVEGVDVKARTISLRNPWGVKHLFDFAVDKVIKFYDSVDIAAK